RRPSAYKINVKCRLAIQSKLVHVSHNANDGGPAWFWIERAEINALPNSIAFRPEALRHGFVDHRPRHFPVVLGENPALAQRDSQCGKIRQTHGSELHNRPRPCVGDGLALNHESRRLAELVAQRQVVYACGFLYAGKRANLLRDWLELQGLP